VEGIPCVSSLTRYSREVLKEAAQSFIATIEFYKSGYGGSKTHQEAIEETLKCPELNRAAFLNLAAFRIALELVRHQLDS